VKDKPEIRAEDIVRIFRENTELSPASWLEKENIPFELMQELITTIIESVEAHFEAIDQDEVPLWDVIASGFMWGWVMGVELGRRT